MRWFRQSHLPPNRIKYSRIHFANDAKRDKAMELDRENRRRDWSPGHTYSMRDFAREFRQLPCECLFQPVARDPDQTDIASRRLMMQMGSLQAA